MTSAAAGNAVFRNAVKRQESRTVTSDGRAASLRAVLEMKTDGEFPPDTKLRSSKHLNNLVRSDDRDAKTRIRPMLWFKRFKTLGSPWRESNFSCESARGNSISADCGFGIEVRPPACIQCSQPGEAGSTRDRHSRPRGNQAICTGTTVSTPSGDQQVWLPCGHAFLARADLLQTTPVLPHAGADYVWNLYGRSYNAVEPGSVEVPPDDKVSPDLDERDSQHHGRRLYPVSFAPGRALERHDLSWSCGCRQGAPLAPDDVVPSWREHVLVAAVHRHCAIGRRGQRRLSTTYIQL